jgi:hypothetical protein
MNLLSCLTYIISISPPLLHCRYIAIHCLDTLIAEFTGSDGGEEDEDDEIAESSFQGLFNDIPSVLCLSIQSNLPYPRIIYCGLRTLLSFFDPEICSKEICAPFGEKILNFCLTLYLNTDLPMFVRAECASVLGNVSVLSSEKLSRAKYNEMAKSFEKIISSPIGENENSVINQDGSNSAHDESLLKAKSLEGFALIGRAVGKKMFLPDALRLLEYFVEKHRQVCRCLSVCLSACACAFVCVFVYVCACMCFCVCVRLYVSLCGVCECFTNVMRNISHGLIFVFWYSYLDLILFTVILFFIRFYFFYLQVFHLSFYCIEWNLSKPISLYLS